MPKSSRRDQPRNWEDAIATPGGGVSATIGALQVARRTRGPNKQPTKEQIAIRLDQDVLSAFRVDGPGWQSRVNAALREWLVARKKLAKV
jgi:uncharacterized protein (DUF4415 family)